MNAITRAGNGAIAIPSHLPEPPLPQPVALYLVAKQDHARARARFYAAEPSEREGMFVGPAPSLPALANSDYEACQRAAAHLAGSLAPVSRALFRAWLKPVNAAVRNPQEEEDFEARCLALHALLDDLPGGCFTSDARRRLPGFFPSAADIRQAVEGDARKLKATADALASAMAPPVEAKAEVEAPRGPRTMEEIAAARASVQKFMAERAAPGGVAELEPVKPRYLSDGHLLAQYEALAREGNGAAAMRAKVLREKLGVRAADVR